MFANDISTAFVLDLLFVVFLFIIWTHSEAKKHQMKHVWLIWIWTFAFGIASGLPLFLYWRESLNKSKD
jgi:EamA domain-containing membrane protein RarD